MRHDDDEVMLFLVTKNYDAMKQFFVDLGFNVPEADHGWQITPAFNEGRGCVINVGSIPIGLEESTHNPPSGPLYLDVGDIGACRLWSVMTKYPVKELGRGFLQSTATFHVVPPDGGFVVFTAAT